MKSIYELYHQDQDERSEVLEMSQHHTNPLHPLHTMAQPQQIPRNEVSPINRNSFSDLQFASHHEPAKDHLVASRASKQSERPPRHTSQHSPTPNPDFLRTKSTNHSLTQKANQPPPFCLNSSQNQLYSDSPVHPLNPRNLPLGRRVGQPPQAMVRQESPAPVSKRPESLSIDRNGAVLVHNARPALIKFNYFHQSNPLNPPHTLSITTNTTNSANMFNNPPVQPSKNQPFLENTNPTSFANSNPVPFPNANPVPFSNGNPGNPQTIANGN